jgi:hypothetical protein
MTTVSPLLAKTADGRVFELTDPFEDDLHDLVAEMNLRWSFLIVERPDLLPSGQHYMQVMIDPHIDWDEGHGYFVEYRDGGPDRHFRAAVRDDRPWGMVWSPAFEQVVKVLQDWAFQRNGWREAMSWERIDMPP